MCSIALLEALYSFGVQLPFKYIWEPSGWSGEELLNLENIRSSPPPKTNQPLINTDSICYRLK